MAGRARAAQGRLRADLPDTQPGRRAATGRPGDSGQSAWGQTLWPPTAIVALYGLTGNPDSDRRQSASPATGQSCRPLRQRSILAEYRIDRKSVLDGLTDEYHITARPPHTQLRKDAGPVQIVFPSPTGSTNATVPLQPAQTPPVPPATTTRSGRPGYCPAGLASSAKVLSGVINEYHRAA
jgi:hypothetical protein